MTRLLPFLAGAAAGALAMFLAIIAIEWNPDTLRFAILLTAAWAGIAAGIITTDPA